MRKLLLFAALACIFGIPLASCDSFIPVDGSGSTTEELVGPTWLLVGLQNSNGETKALNSENVYTLHFGTDGRFGGDADCNSYGGGYDAKNGGYLSVDSLASTLASCGAASHFELFMKGLRTAQEYEVTDDGLRIGYKHKGVLTFEYLVQPLEREKKVKSTG